MKYLLAITLLALMGCSSTQKVEENRKVIELVIWKPVKGLTDSNILIKAKSVNNFIESQKGFISRDLAKGQNGEWMDFLYWDSLENAKAASKKAMQCKVCLSFFKIMEPKSEKFYYFTSKFKHLKNGD